MKKSKRYASVITKVEKNKAYTVTEAVKLVKELANTKFDETVATITREQLKEVAETKLPDLNAYDVEHAMKIVEGTARNMGIKVEK